MVRFTLTLVLAWGFLCCEAAGFSPNSPPPLTTKALPAGKEQADQTRRPQQGNPSLPLLITYQTEIFLDGSPCRYEQVPERAVITFAEVDSDRQTVLRIHFRSRK